MRITSPDGAAAATFSLTRGGRLASLMIAGREFLITANDDEAFGWGSYPMAPYAGRVHRGRFEFEQASFELPITMGPHAIHGTAYARPWNLHHIADDRLEIGTDFGPDWPLGGSVTQRAVLSDASLELAMDVTAGDRAMPVVLGWHPWFRRHIEDSSAHLEMTPTAMWKLDDEAIPTGEMVDPPSGPWDNCFLLEGNPSITWPGIARLDLSQSHDAWVIYNQPAHALCVEPQTDAPDAFNRTPQVLQPNASMTMTFTIEWEDA